MTLETDLRDRFSTVDPQIADLDAGVSGAERASDRRTTANRAVAAGVILIALVVGFTAFSNLTDDSSNEIFTTDPNPEQNSDDAIDETPTTAVAVDEEDPEPASETVAPAPAAPDAIVSNIIGVEQNDTLNARSGPGTNFDVLFEFEPSTTGVVHTGETDTADDGAAWVEVFAPTSGTEFDVGWVNATFLSEVAVPNAKPCLFNGPQDHYIGIDWANSEGSASSEASVVGSIDTYRFGSCIRTVFTFSNDFSYLDGGGQPVAALPTDIVVTRDAPPVIDFGASIVGAEAVESRFSERPGVSQLSFASLGQDGQLDGLVYGPTTTMWVTFDNQNGTVTVDVADIRLPVDADPAIVERIGPAVGPVADGNGVVITSASSSDRSRWTFTGLARPFENQMAVATSTTSGEPVDVQWTGAINEGRVSSSNGVSTTTWTEALGQFSVTITLPDDVPAEEVIVTFDASFNPDGEPDVLDVALADFVS